MMQLLRKMSSEELQELVDLVAGCTCANVTKASEEVDSENLVQSNVKDYFDIIIFNFETLNKSAKEYKESIEDYILERERDFAETVAELNAIKELESNGYDVDNSVIEKLNKQIEDLTKSINEKSAGVKKKKDEVPPTPPKSSTPERITPTQMKAPSLQRAKTAERSSVVTEKAPLVTQRLSNVALGTKLGGNLSGGQKVTTIIGNEIRKGGTISWRNNNPGNMMWGSLSKSYGAIGYTIAADGVKTAVFPTLEMGMKAKMNQLKRPKYYNLTIDDAIYTWTGKNSGKRSQYAKDVAQAAGASLDTRLNQLSEAQLYKVAETITKREGFKPGVVLQAQNKSTNQFVESQSNRPSTPTPPEVKPIKADTINKEASSTKLRKQEKTKTIIQPVIIK